MEGILKVFASPLGIPDRPSGRDRVAGAHFLRGPWIGKAGAGAGASRWVTCR